MTRQSVHFQRRKDTILKELSKPIDEYSDLSPKGAVDVGIRDLVDKINSYDGLVTTSSCSGRISVFAEGHKSRPSDKSHDLGGSGGADQSFGQERGDQASIGGKGGGGKWLYVSHEPLAVSGLSNGEDYYTKLFGLSPNDPTRVEQVAHVASQRFVHLKFEPMIIHVLAASRKDAHNVLAAAHEAGFRESGASTIPVDLNITAPNTQTTSSPIPVAVRATGLAFDNIVGFVTGSEDNGFEKQRSRAIVPETYLRMLIKIANEKFAVNQERKKRFGHLLAARMTNSALESPNWEDAAVRRERKKKEGLAAKESLRRRQDQQVSDCDIEQSVGSNDNGDPSLGLILE